MSEAGPESLDARRPARKPPPPQIDPESLMSTTTLAAFFGRSRMSIIRWRKYEDPERRFPPPDLYINVNPYWRRRTVLDFVEAQASRGVNTKAKGISNLGVAGRQKARAAARNSNAGGADHVLVVRQDHQGHVRSAGALQNSPSHGDASKAAENARAAPKPKAGDTSAQRAKQFGEA